jgi:O-antigen ligase
MLLATALGIGIAISRPRSFTLYLLPIGVLQFGADLEGAGGLANVSAIWLLLVLFVCALAMLRVGSGGLKLNAMEILYLLFLIWCLLEAVRAADHTYAARSFLRLLFPFMSMYLARRNIRSAQQGEKLIRYQFLATFTGAAVSWGVVFVPFIFLLFTQIVWFGAVFFDQAAIIALLALAYWKVKKDFRFLLFAILLVSLCFIAVNRTTLIALVVGGSMFCLLEYRKLAVIMLPSLYVALGAVVLLVPSFRAKMFYQPNKVQTSVVLTTDVLSNQQFNNDGRYAMWTEVLNRFFWPNPIVGSGLGATQEWFYSGASERVLHTKLKVEHSEYVKLASDTGAIGLGLYVAMHLAAFALAIRSYRRAQSDIARIFAIAAACALPAFWVCMAFDNALLYVLPVAQIPTALAAVAGSLSLAGEGVVVIRAQRAAPNPWLPMRRPGDRFAIGGTRL